MGEHWKISISIEKKTEGSLTSTHKKEECTVSVNDSIANRWIFLEYPRLRNLSLSLCHLCRDFSGGRTCWVAIAWVPRLFSVFGLHAIDSIASSQVIKVVGVQRQISSHQSCVWLSPVSLNWFWTQFTFS